MGLFTPDVKDLRELYIVSLKKALNGERQLVEKGLPTMIESSTNPQLADAFRTHLEETRSHATRVEAILNALTGESDDSNCKAMSALIAEGSSEASDADNEALRDVVLLAAGNKVEHHEIAVYGTLRTWAEVLGETAAAQQLEQILQEEKNADDLLTRLSSQINVEAPAAM